MNDITPGLVIALVVIAIIIYVVLTSQINKSNSESFDNRAAGNYVYVSPDMLMGRRYGRINVPVRRSPKYAKLYTEDFNLLRYT